MAGKYGSVKMHDKAGPAVMVSDTLSRHATELKTGALATAGFTLSSVDINWVLSLVTIMLVLLQILVLLPKVFKTLCDFYAKVRGWLFSR